MASLRGRGAPHAWPLWVVLIAACASTGAAQVVASPELAQRTPSSEPASPELPAEPEPEPETEPEPEPEPTVDPELAPHPFSEDQLERILAVQEIVAAAATEHGVDPALINGLIWVESKFEPKAKGPAGARGLMQLMPKTAAAMAERLGRKRDYYNPDFSIHAGTLLLSRLLDRFDGDETLALAGYNRGGGTVSKWVAAGEPLPEGAQHFTERVLEAKSWFERPLPDQTPS